MNRKEGPPDFFFGKPATVKASIPNLINKERL